MSNPVVRVLTYRNSALVRDELDEFLWSSLDQSLEGVENPIRMVVNGGNLMAIVDDLKKYQPTQLFLWNTAGITMALQSVDCHQWLRALWIQDAAIRDFEWLAAIGRDTLIGLNIEGCSIEADWSPLFELGKLKFLSLRKCHSTYSLTPQNWVCWPDMEELSLDLRKVPVAPRALGWIFSDSPRLIDLEVSLPPEESNHRRLIQGFAAIHKSTRLRHIALGGFSMQEALDAMAPLVLLNLVWVRVILPDGHQVPKSPTWRGRPLSRRMGPISKRRSRMKFRVTIYNFHGSNEEEAAIYDMLSETRSVECTPDPGFF